MGTRASSPATSLRFPTIHRDPPSRRTISMSSLPRSLCSALSLMIQSSARRRSSEPHDREDRIDPLFTESIGDRADARLQLHLPHTIDPLDGSRATVAVEALFSEELGLEAHPQGGLHPRRCPINERRVILRIRTKWHPIHGLMMPLGSDGVATTRRTSAALQMSKCPRWGSNPYFGGFKPPASASWATGASAA